MLNDKTHFFKTADETDPLSLSPPLSRWERESRRSRQRRGVRRCAPRWITPEIPGGASSTSHQIILFIHVCFCAAPAGLVFFCGFQPGADAPGYFIPLLRGFGLAKRLFFNREWTRSDANETEHSFSLEGEGGRRPDEGETVEWILNETLSENRIVYE